MNLAVVAGLGLISSFMANNTNTINETFDNSNNNKKTSNTDNVSSKLQTQTVRLFPSDVNAKTKHVYDTRIVPELDKNYYDLAKTQREKSKIPARTNVIPPFFNNPYALDNKTDKPEDKMENFTNEKIMGTVPTSELLKSNNESFSSQFELQSIDNIGEPASMGDAWKSTHRDNILNLERNLATSQGFSPFSIEENDMTYGIVNKADKENFTHNNMQPFSARRDLDTPESNNFEYKMEVFAGSSKNWNPKREVLPFFDPEHFKQIPFGSELVTDAERDRIIEAKAKQNERPFEPIRVAPGLNLKYDEQPKHGRHDPFRAMFRTTDEMRPQTKPKETFEGRIQAAPKKGEKRGVVAPVIKRRPEQWRYQTVDDLVPNKSLTTGQKLTGKFIIPDNARSTDTRELIGPAEGTKRVGPDNREGEVKITKRVTHVEDKLGPNATTLYNSNTKSFSILENQRHTTQNNDYTPVGYNPQQATKVYDDKDIAKSTIRQTLTNKEFNTAARQLVGNYSNLSDTAKATVRQIIDTQPYEQIVSMVQRNGYTNITDDVKQTLKQIVSTIQFNTNTGSTQKETYGNLQDNAKNTNKQTLTNKEFNTNTGSTQKETYGNFQDDAKNTNKQTLTNKEFNTNAGRAQKETYGNFQDDAKNTTRQTMTNKEFNTNAGRAQKETYGNFQDGAKNTTRQTMTDKEFKIGRASCRERC